MTNDKQGCCTRCGAALRRRGGLRSQAWCDPCQRVGPDPRRDLPAGFYSQDPIVAALADYDFRTVFRRIRMATSWSQQILGQVVGLDQSRISAIERGVRPLRDVAQVAQVATRLGIPAILLGFGTPGTTLGQAGGEGRKLVSWVDRRDFVQHIAGLAVGVAGMAALDIDRLTALLPQVDPTGTRHIGLGDVEVIERTTATFRLQDFATGARQIRDLAVTQLHSVLPLLTTQMTPEVRPRLHLATADLALQAGYMSFDCNQHDDARRLWMIGLDIARHAEHPQGNDLAVFLLYDMASQAVHLGRPKEALSLIHLGHAAAAGSHPVSAATLCCLTNNQARAHAAQGDAPACDRALGQAVEQVNAVDLATTPPWSTQLIDEASISGYQGAAQYTLALAGKDPGVAMRAVASLSPAMDRFGSSKARSRALYLPDLAGAHAIAGDTDTAVRVGHQAVDTVTALHSPRAYDKLRVLNTVLEPLHTSAGVTELRDRLTATAV